jgi:hypothetical protein
MTDEDKKTNPHAAGFYQNDKNRLVGDAQYSDEELKGIISHEFEHFFSNDDFEKNFTGFLNEGMTEYIRLMHERNFKTGYGRNVELVSFLHEQFGDKFIKAYFTGDCYEIDSKLVAYMGGTKNTQLKAALHKLYRAVYDYGTNSPEEKSAFSQALPTIVEACVAILRGSILEKAKRFEYYKDGRLDTQMIRADIMSGLHMPSYVIDYLQKNDLLIGTFRSICEEVLDRTHLFADVPEEQKATIREMYAAGILQKVEDITKEIESNDQDVLKKVFAVHFQNSKIRNARQFMDEVLGIVVRFPDSTPSERKEIILQYIPKLLGPDVDVDLVLEYVERNMPVGLKQEELKIARERGTISSEYTMVDEYLAIERRDNEDYLIRILDDGSLEEIGKIMLEEGTETYHVPIQSSENGRQTVWSDVFTKFKKDPNTGILRASGNNPYRCKTNPLVKNLPQSLDAFVKHLRTRSFIQDAMKEMKDSISIQDDAPEPLNGVENVGIYYGSEIKDYRSREINVQAVRTALKKLSNFYPNSEQLEFIQKKLMAYLIEEAYDVDPKDISEDMVSLLYSIVMADDKTQEEAMNTQSRLENFHGYMNEQRRKAQDAKDEDIYFPDLETRKEYTAMGEAYQVKQQVSSGTISPDDAYAQLCSLSETLRQEQVLGAAEKILQMAREIKKSQGGGER